jgi:dihydrofolate synthase/folylpolyglutamate synthase
LQLLERGNQTILLDGAHNVAGAKTLKLFLDNFPKKNPTFIFGALADKNWPDICQLLAPLTDKIFTVPVTSSRTADADKVAQIFRQVKPTAKVAVCKNFQEANAANKDEPFIVVTGSLYLIGEALEILGGLPADGNERSLNEWTVKR